MNTSTRSVFALFLLTFSILSFAETFLFYHGGPGFNSIADKAVIQEQMEKDGQSLDIRYWNEPSKARGFEDYNGFSTYLSSAQNFLFDQTATVKSGKVTLIGVSFGAIPVLEMAAKFPEKINQIVLVAPALDIPKAAANTFRLAKEIYEDLEGDVKTPLNQKAITRLSSTIDRIEAGVIANEEIAQGYMDALGAQGLMVKYFQDPTYLGSYFAKASVDPAWGMQLPEMKQLFSTLNTTWQSKQIIVPAYLFFGAKDSIVKAEEQLPAIEGVIKTYTVGSFLNSGHMPYVEEAENFASMLYKLH